WGDGAGMGPPAAGAAHDVGWIPSMLRSGGARRNEQDRMWIDAAGRDGHEAFQLISRSLHDLRDLVAAA
ncbi:hypothetical protein, partial [Ralstonia pseudosolanacearum]|uniref:hypothetical protein n=3 Tax=Ralstonia pseudosolanacearum TaxID=1310165 RepID=UPI003221DF69